VRAIFVSYRRDDSEGEAGRLFDDLVAVFGENSVFMDVAAIEVGRDFRKAIEDSVSTCGVVLAVIGKGWIDAKNEAGQRRLDDPTDFVRLETASALRRDIPVVPVLVRGAKMPRIEQLPDDLKELSYRNGVELTHARWNSDLQLLVRALRPFVDPKNPASSPTNRVREGVAAAGKSVLTVSGESTTVPEAKSAIASPRQKKSLATILVLVVAVAVAVISVAYMVVLNRAPAAVSQPSLVEIPPLIGESLDDARRTLADRQLQVGAIERKPRTGVARDTVLQEFPVAGEKVKGGSKVDLMVSDAPERTNAEAPKGGASGQASRSIGAQKGPASPPAPGQPPTAKGTAETPAEGVKPPDQVANMGGIWYDAKDVATMQVSQRGDAFTYTLSSAGGTGKGSGTIKGLEFESSYTNFYTKGGTSSGRCTGTISASGSMVRFICLDPVFGQVTVAFTR